MIVKEMWEEFKKNRLTAKNGSALHGCMKTTFHGGVAAGLRKLYDLPEDTPIEDGAEIHRQMEEEVQAYMVDLDLKIMDGAILCKRCKKNPVSEELLHYGVCDECWNEIIESHEGKLDHQKKKWGEA